MYIIEIALKFSPFPLSVQRKDLRSAQALYSQVTEAMQKGQPRLLELSCQKIEDKKIAVLSNEILAVQVYEKAASSGGLKRPGFSFQN